MREVPLTTRAFDLLTALRRPQGLLFTYRKSPIRDLKTAWAAAIRRAGIAHYRFHDLRHTFNSRLVEAEVIADVRKELMGHSRVGTFIAFIPTSSCPCCGRPSGVSKPGTRPNSTL